MGEPHLSVNLLYVRRNGKIKGPYAAGAVRDFLARNQVMASDEVSTDRRHWVPAAQMDRVLHQEEEATALSLFEQRRRASMRAAQAGPVGHIEERRKLQLPLTTLAVVTALFFLIILFGVWIGKPDMDLPPTCQAQPAAGIIWRSCSLNGLKAPDSHLQHADLRATQLRNADLSRSDLSGANASYAILEGANLSYTTLVQANLKGAALKGADLTYADLSEADLSYADLTGARLGGAHLSGVRLRNTIWTDGNTCSGTGPESCLPLPVASQAKDSVSYR